MRPLASLTLILLLVPSVLAADPAESKSALESHPTGWTDLLAGGLKEWNRVPIPPEGKLKEPNPWSIEDGTLHCKGAGAGHEMLLLSKPFKDGILHIEWRFKKVEGKKGYNSGVYARNSADGKVWHQAQVGSKNVGFLFGETPTDGKLQRFRAASKVEQRGKEAGEWNTFEITCKGKTVTLWVNGAVTATWNDCEMAEGHVGVEAEGWDIEFREVKFRPLP